MDDTLLFEAVKDIDKMGGNVDAAAKYLTSSLVDYKKYGEMAKLYLKAMRGQRRNMNLIEDSSGLTVGELVDLLSTFDAADYRLKEWKKV